MFFQAFAHCTGAGFVVDAGIKAQLVYYPVALGFSTRNAHHAATFDLGHLAHGLPHRTGRAGHYQGFTGLGLAHVHQTEVAGHTRHAQHVEPLRQAAHAQINFHQARAFELGSPQTQILLHAKARDHGIAHREMRTLGRNHPAHTTGTHHFANGHRRDVAAPLIHPAAHRRVQRQGQRLQHHAAVFRLCHRFGGGAPVVPRRQTHRARGQAELVVGEGG